MSKDKGMAILNAATQVFSEKGFEQTRIESIARRAGVGKGTVYEYYQSKQQLFEEVLRHATQSYADVITTALHEGKTLEEALELSMYRSLCFVAEQRSVSRILVDHPTGGASLTFRKWIMELRREVFHSFRECIIRHAREPFAHDVTLASHIYLGALNNLAIALLLDEPLVPEQSIEDMARESVRILVDGLRTWVSM